MVVPLRNMEKLTIWPLHPVGLEADYKIVGKARQIYWKAVAYELSHQIDSNYVVDNGARFLKSDFWQLTLTSWNWLNSWEEVSKKFESY